MTCCQSVVTGSGDAGWAVEEASMEGNGSGIFKHIIFVCNSGLWDVQSISV